MTETSERPMMNDGRSVAHAMLFAKLCEKAIQSPHRTTKIRQEGYGPASFDIAYMEPDGSSSGRFVTVTVTPFRDGALAVKINAEADR